MQPLSDHVKHPKRQASKPSNKATSKLNPQTGVVSKIQSNFSTENWGMTTSNYMRSIEKMREGSLEEIAGLAKCFMSPLKSHCQETSLGSQSLSRGNLQDVRACLVDEWYVFSPSCLILQLTKLSEIVFLQPCADREQQDYLAGGLVHIVFMDGFHLISFMLVLCITSLHLVCTARWHALVLFIFEIEICTFT